MTAPNRTAMRLQWKLHKALWHASGARLGRRVIGMPVLELVTTGHRTGTPRSILITYVLDGDRPAIIGTNAGADHDPAWANNLRRHPVCRIRRNGNWHDATAEFLEHDEHQRILDLAVAANPGYASYRNATRRHIPIVRFTES
jgi:deazaflavin-dependent oxidoreductase (nitroreductase family)